MAGELAVRVLTPNRVVAERSASSVLLHCVDGEKGILPRHESCALQLAMGLMYIYEGNEEPETLFVMGGVASVVGDTVVVLSEMAGGPQEVEQALARIEQAKEERRLEEQRSALDIQRAEVALRNALVHMDVSSYAVLGKMAGDGPAE